MIAAGYAVTPGEIFDTFTISGVDSKQAVSALLKSGFNARFVNAETIGLTFDETITDADLVIIAGALQVKLSDHKTFPIEG